MAVTAIRLQNFMGFEDTGWLELRSITLLFGKNSSGKSAIIRALLLLKQSLDASDEDGPLIFATEDGVDLGSFQRMIRGREIEELLPDGTKKPKQMVFGFRCEVPWKDIERLFGTLGSDNPPHITELEFSLSYQWNKEKKLVELSTVTIEASETDGVVDRITLFESYFTWTDKSESESWYSWSELVGNDFDLKDFNPSWFYWTIKNGFIPKVNVSAHAPKSLPFIGAVAENFAGEIDVLLKSVQYLGPLRYKPQRYYFLPRKTNHKQDQEGLGAIREFLVEGDQKSEEILSEWIRKLKLGERISKRPLLLEEDVLADAYELLIDKQGDETVVGLLEVGYGTPQVLPIVIKALNAPENSLVIIEQPEVHLHPAAQADLADLFIQCIHNDRVTRQGSLRFLIETHSEHLILRLLRRIRETTEDELETKSVSLSPHDIAVVYIMSGSGVSNVHHLPATEEGDFTEKWPEGFFTERAKELF